MFHEQHLEQRIRFKGLLQLAHGYHPLSDPILFA